MPSTRFSKASAVVLSLCTLSDAWALYHQIDSRKTTVEDAPVELRRHDVEDINEKRQTTELFCPNDRYEQFLDNNPDDSVQTFCNEWLNLSPATTVIEYTPTITITTSNSITTTTTLTTRLVTTETVTRTATTTLAPVKARAANIAAVAEDIFNSVVNSGVAPTAVSTADNAQRAQAASGLANACSCKLVNPTSTVTQSYALPAAYTTVGYRVIILSASTSTRKYTVFTTVTETPKGSASLASSSASSAPSGTPASSAVSVSDANSSAPGSSTSSVFIPQTAVLPIQATGTSANSVATPGADSSVPVVAAVPFSCPDAANTQMDQVVGGFKLDYLIYCNTEIISEDRIGAPIDTDTETTCAAQCSVLNSQNGQGACQAAAWTPYTDGRAGGSCVLSGKNTEYAIKPGAVAIINTGISSNGDCAALDAANANRTIDTSALAASITQGVSVSTPGLLTQTVGGGVYQTYVSANSTDAGGTVHWSWYAVSASSSFWEAVYATSWSCTRTIVQTIVQQPPTALPVTITTEATTTIINGATTTIISGTSTRIIVNGGGLFGPGTSFVPATTTSGNGEVTTFFSTATATSTGDSGIIPPSTGAVATPSLPAPSGGVYTSSSIVNNNGSVVIVVSGSTATYVSAGTGGIIPPSPSAPEVEVSTTTTTTTLGFNGSVSGGTSTYFSESGNGAIPPVSIILNSTEIVSAGSTVVIISGSTATTISGGGNGEVPPTPSRSVVTVVETVSLGSANVTLASSTATAISTGGEGIIPPSSPTPSTPVSIIESVSFGSVNFTIGSSTITANSTGGQGLIPPTPSPSGPVTIVETVSLGSLNFTIGSSTMTANSTGGEGIIPPASTGSSTAPSGPSTTTTTTTLSGSIPPSAFNTSSNALPTETPGLNVTVFTSSGVEIVSIGSSTAISTSTGASGAIPPPSSAPGIFLNVTTSSGIEISSTFSSTYTVTSTGASGLIPPASANATTSTPISVTSTPEIEISSTGEIVQITVSNSTYTSSATGSGGIITPSTNSTVPVVSVSTGSTGTNSDSPRSPFPLTSSSTPVGSASSPMPSSNSTIPVGTGSSATLSVNSTTVVVSSSITLIVPPSASSSNVTTSLGSTGTNSDSPRSPFPLTSSSTPVGSASSPMPSSNSTIPVGTGSSATLSVNSTTVVVSSSITLIVPPSASSSNVTTSLGSTGTNSDSPRSPFPLTSSSTPIGSASSPIPSSNSTTSAGTTSPPAPFTNSTVVVVSSSVTLVVPPSTPSANVSMSLGSTGTNSDAPRTPFPLTSSTPLPSSGSIVPFSNASVTIPPSGSPSLSLNITTSILTSVFANSTTVSGSITPSSNSTRTTPPSVTTSASFNVTISVGSTGTNSDEPRSPFPIPTPSASFNASSSIPPASANSTVPASSTPLTGIFTQITPSGNTTIVTSTSVPVPSASTPYPSRNITSSPPVTETVVVPPTGGNITISSSTVVSITVPSNSANVTIPVTIPFANTTTSVPSLTPTFSANITTSVPSLTPIVSTNVTTSVPSLTPTLSANITYTPPFPTGGFNSSSIPSASPTPSFNSSVPPASICPTVAVTVTEIQFATSIQVVTETVVSTVTAPAAIVVPASLASAISFAAPEATSSLSAPDASSTPDAGMRESIFRARNATASPFQRGSACSGSEIIVRNPDFELGADGSVVGWDTDSTNPNMTLNTVPLPGGKGTIAQFNSAAADRKLVITQALTLCPGVQYQFSVSTQQANKLAGCSITFSLVYADGTRDEILQVTPEETWSKGTASFTAGKQPEADIEIAAQCQGPQDAADTNEDVLLRADVRDVSIVRES